MDSFWIWIVMAATTSAALGALTSFVVLKRSHALLQERLVRTEQARNGAVERSAQAREQIAQLNRAIDEMRRAHSVRPAPSAPAARASEETRAERRERAEKALREVAAPASEREPLQAFADTLPLDHGT